MERPQELHLLPRETYPTDRRVEDELKEPSVAINNMSEMAQFVYKFYMERFNVIKEKMESIKTLYEKPPVEMLKNKKGDDDDEDDNEEDNDDAEPTQYAIEPVVVVPAKPVVKETIPAPPIQFVPTLIQNEVEDIDEDMEKKIVDDK